MPGVRFAPFPYWASMKHMGLSPEAVGQWALEQVEWVLKTQTAPGETAAMILEPILGEGGFVVPPQVRCRYIRIPATATTTTCDARTALGPACVASTLAGNRARPSPS